MPIRNVLRCTSVCILATDCLAPATPASFGALSSAHIRSRALPSCPVVLRRSLHSNKLVQLPDELGCATGLVWLSLNTNSLTRLPESVGQLTNMVRISLVSQTHVVWRGNGSLCRVSACQFSCQMGRQVRLQACSLADMGFKRAMPMLM